MENGLSKLMKRRQYNRQWMNKKRKLTANRLPQRMSFSSDDDAEIVCQNAIVGEATEVTEQTTLTHVELTASEPAVRQLESSNAESSHFDAEKDEPCFSTVGLLEISDESAIGHASMSTDSDSDFPSNKPTFAQKLAEWVNHCDIKGSAVDRLLKLLKTNGHPEL